MAKVGSVLAGQEEAGCGKLWWWGMGWDGMGWRQRTGLSMPRAAVHVRSVADSPGADDELRMETHNAACHLPGLYTNARHCSSSRQMSASCGSGLLW